MQRTSQASSKDQFKEIVPTYSSSFPLTPLRFLRAKARAGPGPNLYPIFRGQISERLTVFQAVECRNFRGMNH
jgi:hypothetical protein